MKNFTDKYFTKSRQVIENQAPHTTVKYRIFPKFQGVAALEPVKKLIEVAAPKATVRALPEGEPFDSKSTIMTVSGKFVDLVELETQILQWTSLPCYTANKMKRMKEAARDKPVLDFSARHLPGVESQALATYGALVGGVDASSSDLGNINQCLGFLENLALMYDSDPLEIPCGVGTVPHALIAAFRGNTLKTARAYVGTFPDEPLTMLIDYNNLELDDTYQLLEDKLVSRNLKAVRLDTCGENVMQGLSPHEGRGVQLKGVQKLRNFLDSVGHKNVGIVASSGFDLDKIAEFELGARDSVSAYGTGSFIPSNIPQATMDICEINGQPECKAGREWGFEENEMFEQLLEERGL